VAPKHWLRWLVGALAAVHLCGCRTMSWDDLTSREFTVKSLWTPPPPPLTVIAKSTDGYARTKALNKLDEPRHPAELEKHIQVLEVAAVSDRDPLCRLAALRTLGRYKDPRAAKILQEVYLGDPKMSPENNAFIRQQALTSLQSSSPAEAKQLFIQAAKQPSGSLTGAAQRDRLEILDERLTAIRALGKYPQPDAVETLVKLMETEKDIAIRTCAHESLVTATKKDVPADGKAWREYLATGREPARQNAGMLASLTKTKPAPTPTPSPAPAPASNGPGIFDTISNWVRPEKTPGQTTSSPVQPPPTFPTPNTSPPSPLPSTLPTSPLLPNILRRDANPSANTNVVPAGATRNSQGELVIPVTP
jgi:hypothetical protein